MPLHPRVVRAEVDDVLLSGRLHRLVSVQAQVFHLIDAKWVELTTEPILVHLIHDKLEGVAKMLAIWRLKLVINNVPVSSNFNIHTPSKKFLQFVCNKFDKNSDIYGFGFADSSELDLFNQQLIRIKSAAMASLTPSFHLGSNSLPQTPTRSHRRVLFPRSSYGGEGSSVLSLTTGRAAGSTPSPSSNSISPPYGYVGSPMRNLFPRSESTSSFHLDPQTPSKEEPINLFSENIAETSSRLPSYLGYDGQAQGDSLGDKIEDKKIYTRAEGFQSSIFENPYVEASPLSSPKAQMTSFHNVEKIFDIFSQFKINDGSNATEEEIGCSSAERRLSDFSTAFDISTPALNDMAFNIFNIDDIPTNSAGAIGTPVKGKGGVNHFNVEVSDVEVNCLA